MGILGHEEDWKSKSPYFVTPRKIIEMSRDFFRLKCLIIAGA